MRFADYALLALLAVAVFFIIRHIVRRRKSGRIGCAGCTGDCATCHKDCETGAPPRDPS